MKPTQVIDLFANIKNSIVSFISVLMFAALGVAVFLGISWAKPALENGGEGMFNQGSFHHFQIQYPYGLTQSDLEELSHVEGVSQIEPEYQSFQAWRKNGKEFTVKLQSLGESIDTPIVVKGELPTRPNELAFHAESAERLGVSVGDTITFEKDANESAKAKKNKTDSDGMEYLKNGSFKVTAIIKSADYASHEISSYGISTSPTGTVDALAWATDDAFDASAYQDGYPVVNVRCDSLADKRTFTNEFQQASDAIQEPLEILGTKLATARYESLHGQVQKEVDEGQKKLDDGQKTIDETEAKIAQGEKDIADGEKKLEDGRAELAQGRAEGQAELDDAYRQLMEGEAAKSEAEAKINDATTKINEAQERIDEADRLIATANDEVTDAEQFKADCDAELSKGKITQEEYNRLLDNRGAQVNERLQPLATEYGVDVPKIDHSNFGIALSTTRKALDNSESIPVVVEGEKMTLGEARKRLNSARSELEAAQNEYDQKVKELDDGWALYREGQQTLEQETAKAEKEIFDGEKKLEDAKTQVEDGKRQVEDGKRQVEDGKPVLEEGKALLAQMPNYSWTVLPRSYNLGLCELTVFSDVTNSLSISMAALFIIVGLLVSYFAMSRIVREQVTQIGTKKALGLRQGEITASFLWYSGISVAVGAILGALGAYFIVEGIINGVLGSMFAFGPYPSFFGWELFLIISVIELVLILGTTYLACRTILKQHAVDLLRGDNPSLGKPHFYEKWGIWQKLPLFIQIIVNNCINEKRRALSTIVGVAGCTALIVTAITLNNDVMKSYDRHFENVYGFNAIAYVESEPKDAANNVESALKERGFLASRIFRGNYFMLQPDGEMGITRVIVPMDNEAFGQLYHVNPIQGGTVDLSADGAWISQAYAEHFGAKVGDNIALDDSNGNRHQVPILGIQEFWLSCNEMVIGKQYFEKEFGDSTPNCVLCQTNGTPVADVEQELKSKSIEGFYSIIDSAAIEYESFDTFSAVSTAVVIVYIVLSALMAIVVLLNLNIMFIAEKKRELIVLMINGFSIKDARHYISYDNIALTAVGIIVGILLGVIMGSITVLSIEPVTGVFIKSPDGIAILTGILGSALLAIVMALISLRRINKFELTDINRF